MKEDEKLAVLACLHEERFQDCSPAQVYASLLDDGLYHCSIRTMYRLLALPPGAPQGAVDALRGAIERAQRIDEAARQRGMGGELNT